MNTTQQTKPLTFAECATMTKQELYEHTMKLAASTMEARRIRRMEAGRRLYAAQLLEAAKV